MRQNVIPTIARALVEAVLFYILIKGICKRGLFEAVLSLLRNLLEALVYRFELVELWRWPIINQIDWVLQNGWILMSQLFVLPFWLILKLILETRYLLLCYLKEILATGFIIGLAFHRSKRLRALSLLTTQAQIRRRLWIPGSRRRFHMIIAALSAVLAAFAALSFLSGLLIEMVSLWSCWRMDASGLLAFWLDSAYLLKGSVQKLLEAAWKPVWAC